MSPAENAFAASLVIVESHDSTLVGQTLALTTPRFIIGRRPDKLGLQLSLQLVHYLISPYHADIRYMVGEGADEYGFYVRDMNSENGTKLNGETIQAGTSVKLNDGDEISLGFTVLKFSQISNVVLT